MESIFRPNKWFVLFCALLILVWGGYQLVANMRIANEAKLIGQDIFTWDWPELGWSSNGLITDATVVRRNDTDAIVKIKGKQLIRSLRSGAQAAKDSQQSSGTTTPDQVMEANATLTFYRLSNNWVLGRVELP